MFKKIFKSLKLAVLVLICLSALAYFSAPAFFGIVFITGAVAATVAAWSGIAFVASLAYQLFFSKLKEEKATDAPAS